MVELSSLGFIEGVIVEVVASTVDREGRPNAAPMGVTVEGGLMVLRPFKTSRTYRNLASTMEVVLNVTDDPAIFAITALKLEEPKLIFEEARTVKPPRIKGAQAYVEAKVTHLAEDNDRARVECKPIHVEANLIYPSAYCRAKPAVIEALIHATRVKEFTAKGLKNKAETLLELVDYYVNLVKRVAPSSTYTLLAEEIKRKVEAWYFKA